MTERLLFLSFSLSFQSQRHSTLQEKRKKERKNKWAGTLGGPRGKGWVGWWEGGSGWGTHVNPWLIHVNVWQKPLQYCKVISLQLIKINEKK